MKAILVKNILKGFARHAALYRMEPPLDGHGFVIASATSLTPTGPETYLFPADAEGGVVSWAKMDGSYRGGLSHAEAFAGAGYSIELPTQVADSQSAPVRDVEREAFKAAHQHLELDEVSDGWGRPTFKHPHIEASWLGWIARAARAPADSVTAPVGGGSILD
jgi:hypothetical protein